MIKYGQIIEEVDKLAFYDRKLLLSNINVLKERYGVKIGDLESNANVSPGYFSRLNKEESKASPSIEVICAVAENLGVSVDDLLMVDYSKLTPTQEYLMSFMNKLIKDTQEDNIYWGRETADELNSLEPDYDGDVPHPLFDMETYIDWNEDPAVKKEITRVCFKSTGYGCNTKVWGPCYRLRLKNGVTVFVMHVGMNSYSERSHDVESLELWLYDPKSGRQFVCGSIGQYPFSDKLKALHREIEKAEYRPKIRKDLRYAIDAFMEDDLDDDPPPSFDDLEPPF